MSKIKYPIILFLLLLIVSVTDSVLAQEELTETFVAEDGSFAFRYPEGWKVDTSNELFTQLVNGPGADNILIVSFVSPATLAVLVPDASDPVDALTKVQEIIDIITGEPAEITSAGRDAALATIDTEAQEGLAVVVDLGKGEYGLILAVTLPGEREAVMPMVNALAASFTLPEEGMVSSASSDVIQTLEDSDKTWQEAIAELQDLKMIGPGGSLVFQENQAFFSGQGNFFTPLARRLPYADIVMAGELIFNTSGSEEFESCILLSRISTDSGGSTSSFTEVGLFSDGSVVVNDRPESGTPNMTIEELGLDLDESHHFLYLLQDDSLTLYVDGKLVVGDFAVVDRAGTYGIALRGKGAGARCEGRNIWVYQVVAFEPGVCEVSAYNNVNKRSGPGTSFDRAGQLTEGTVLQVIGRSEKKDGFIWVKLEDDSWVREDVVLIQGDCSSLPVVTD